MPDATSLKQRLIKNGVANMQQIGYQTCNEQNIINDSVFRAFFALMLKYSKGEAGKDVDDAIDRLLHECNDAS